MNLHSRRAKPATFPMGPGVPPRARPPARAPPPWSCRQANSERMQTFSHTLERTGSLCGTPGIARLSPPIRNKVHELQGCALPLKNHIADPVAGPQKMWDAPPPVALQFGNVPRAPGTPGIARNSLLRQSTLASRLTPRGWHLEVAASRLCSLGATRKGIQKLWSAGYE